MPGANCVFPDCGISRKNPGVGIFQIPKRKNDFYTNWRKELIDVIKKYRVVDKVFKERLENGKVYICERHFEAKDIILTKTGRKTLEDGALPSTNLPKKSCDTKQPSERRVLTRNIESGAVLQSDEKSTSVHKNFDELTQKISRVKLKGWQMVKSYDKINLKFNEEPYVIPKFEVIVDESLEFSIAVFGWKIPDDSVMYKAHKRSVRNISMTKFLAGLFNFNLCEGVDCDSPSLRNHVLPCKLDHDDSLNASPTNEKVIKREANCMILLNEKTMCEYCCRFKLNLEKKAKKMKNPLPAKKNAPLTTTDPCRVQLALKNERLKCRQLEQQIKVMKWQIENKSVDIDNSLSYDMKEIMSNNIDKASPFMKLFWEQQNKLTSVKKGAIRYHPMIIRFCLSIASKSSSAYDELRNSNVLVLPSRRTLRDYKNAIRPKAGFHKEVIDELIETAKPLSGYRRYVTISFDEMKVQENLVYDKHTGQLIGYVDLGDPELNFSTFQNVTSLATHVLVYYVRGMASDLKFSLAYFATKGVTAYQIMPTFWDAVSILELTCRLRVIAAVSDGASSNRKFIAMHSGLADQVDNNNVTYRTINLYAPNRFIYFFADAPHLVKTTRNCIFHSGDGRGSRHLWNDGQHIVWQHFIDLYNSDSNCGLKILPKLSQDHIFLTPFSVMRVNLAAQILSESVSKVLSTYFGIETHGTAKLCDYMDKFFDCLNVRNQIESTKKRKPFLEPYRDVNDERFSWINEFLLYLKQWKMSIIQRPGNFDKTTRSKMFLSWQTYQGLQITALSMVEAVKFLLNEGMPFVLTEKFNQDVLEEYFGKHRNIGRRNDNPDMYLFGYNSNTLRMQRSVAPVTGNTRGAHSQKRHVSWYKVDDTPLKKRKKEN